VSNTVPSNEPDQQRELEQVRDADRSAGQQGRDVPDIADAAVDGFVAGLRDRSES
jgi:hypothetical protein